MAQSELDQLLNQLADEDAKVRREAVKRLGDLAQPEAIPELANIYEQDQDEGVRKAAAEAMRKFRRMEQQARRDAEGSGSGSSGPLRRVRTILLIVLVLTVAANVVIAAPGLIARFSPPAPTQFAPTDRSALIDGLSSRITAIRGMAVLLQNGFRGLQGMGAEFLVRNKPLCDQVKANQVSTEDLSAVDTMTYPDLPPVSLLINQAALQATGLRGNYLLVCDAGLSAADLTKQLGQMDLAKMVADADAITGTYLGDANNRLQNAIEHPAPTVGPSVTPTPTETLTPTITLTPSITPTQPTPTHTPLGATAAPTSAANVPTRGAQPGTQAATAAGTPSLTPIPSVTFDGFHLDKLTSYQYQLSIDAEGTYLNGDKYSNSMQFAVMQQTSPLVAQYSVSGTSVNIGKGTPGPMGMATIGGSTTFIVMNNAIFVTGDMLRQLAPNASRCATVPLNGNDKLIPKMDLTDLTAFSSVPLVLVPLKPGEGTVNGMKVKHYHADQKQGTNAATLDLWLSDDDLQLPVQVVGTVTLQNNPSDTTSTPAPYQQLTISIEYNLTAHNQPVTVTKPTGCGTVPTQGPTPKPTVKPKATAKK